MLALLPYMLGLLGAAIIIAIIHLAEKFLIRHASWRRSSMYPADHALASHRVLELVDVLATNHDLSDEEIVTALVQRDVPEFDAELLVRFISIAFSWVILRKMGVSSFPRSFVVLDGRGRPVEMAIAREHYFGSALVIADQLVQHGFSERITRPTFEAIIARSGDMDATNQALAAGKVVSGGRVLPPILLGLPAEAVAARFVA